MAGWRRIVGTLCRHRRFIAAMALGGVVVFLWLFFPQPDPELWPPKGKPDENLAIHVCIDYNHSLIYFADYELGGFQEWHLGVRSWYLNREFSILDRFKSLLLPVPGVIRFGAFPVNYALQHNLPPEKTFRFYLSAEGKNRLMAYLHRDRREEIKRNDDYIYFATPRTWHLLWNCNSFVGGALEAAGLPVREIVSLEPITMTWQLQRCQAFQKKYLEQK